MSHSSVIHARFHGHLGGFRLDASFQIPAKGVTGLFGPSGSGKTTILRCMAGLTRLQGHVSVNDHVWQDDAAGIFLKPHQRALGYVFQEASLFPHLSVRENLLYGQRRAKGPEGRTPFELDDVISFLGLASLIGRNPSALSGGERQRVSIGRALLSQPQILLLDEPLSALDQKSKDEILPFLEALHEKLSIPSIYVTHDMRELERLADTLVLIEKGRVISLGPLSDLQTDIQAPLMQLPDASVILEGYIARTDEAFGLVDVMIDDSVLVVPAANVAPGAQIRCRIRASDVSFARIRPEQTSILNCLPVQIVSVSDRSTDPAHVNIIAALGRDGDGPKLIGRITRKSQHNLGLSAGDQVFAQIKSVSLVQV